GATSVRVEIKNGGITYMSVTDNGEGMERDDVPVAFLRHATSKVRTAPDLDAIATLGFRGEALASVAAVSRVELITRREDDLAGTHYTIEGGDPGELEDIGCAKGTTIVVRDLFYNVPARMKFLKKDVSEANAVAAVMDRLALSHPDISFAFVRDGKEELFTAGDGDLRGCIHAVLGRDFAKNLLAVDYELGGIKVNGFVSSPAAPRPNRTMQHTFVNRRYVKSRTAMAALEQAFKGSIMGGKFPACVLFLEMPPETVDANVHPAKVEIRFIDERPVFSAVYHAVKTALEQGARPKAVTLPTPPVKPTPSGAQLHLDFQKPVAPPVVTTPSMSHTPERSRPFVPDIVREEEPRVAVTKSPEPLLVQDITFDDGATAVPPVVSKIIRDTVDAISAPPVLQPVEERTSPAQTVQEEAVETEVQVVEETAVRPVVRYIGELFCTYLLAEMDGRLYVIDKHAAHERLLYNQLVATPHNESQQLLAPLSVSLSREEYAALMNHTEELATVGFEVEEFGGHEVLIRGVPLLLSGCDISQVIREIAGGFADGLKTVRSSALDWIYHSTACR
ncbi:MAG: DNA mismatch repair endonuclease MutL, partial [Clostridia bacterium]|nr:DNA mismatch repair endonuclease MutL [Clostridia bacterium]